MLQRTRCLLHRMMLRSGYMAGGLLPFEPVPSFPSDRMLN
jgi:hypothetical protein